MWRRIHTRLKWLLLSICCRESVIGKRTNRNCVARWKLTFFCKCCKQKIFLKQIRTHKCKYDFGNSTFFPRIKRQKRCTRVREGVQSVQKMQYFGSNWNLTDCALEFCSECVRVFIGGRVLELRLWQMLMGWRCVQIYITRNRLNVDNSLVRTGWTVHFTLVCLNWLLLLLFHWHE